jgi:protease-4
MRFLILIGLLSLLSGCVVFNQVDFSDLVNDKIEAKYAGGNPEGDAKIAIVPLHGMIVGTSSDSPLSRKEVISPAKVEQILAVLRKQKEGLIGVVLEINSPGGSAAASEEIYDQLVAFKKEMKIPLVAYYLDVAASGGYYISLAADRIIANPNALTGSIGVIVTFPQFHKLMKNKLEVDVVTFKSGKFKDSGSAFRSMTKEEQEYWQKLTMMYFDRFVSVVAEGRSMTKAQVKSVTQGQVMHPQFALENKLIDEIGKLKDAVSYISKRSGRAPNSSSLQWQRISGSGSSNPIIPGTVHLKSALDPYLGVGQAGLDPSLIGAVLYLR